MHTIAHPQLKPVWLSLHAAENLHTFQIACTAEVHNTAVAQLSALQALGSVSKECAYCMTEFLHGCGSQYVVPLFLNWPCQLHPAQFVRRPQPYSPLKCDSVFQLQLAARVLNLN